MVVLPNKVANSAIKFIVRAFRTISIRLYSSTISAVVSSSAGFFVLPTDIMYFLPKPHCPSNGTLPLIPALIHIFAFDCSPIISANIAGKTPKTFHQNDDFVSRSTMFTTNAATAARFLYDRIFSSVAADVFPVTEQSVGM